MERHQTVSSKKSLHYLTSRSLQNKALLFFRNDLDLILSEKLYKIGSRAITYIRMNFTHSYFRPSKGARRDWKGIEFSPFNIEFKNIDRADMVRSNEIIDHKAVNNDCIHIPLSLIERPRDTAFI